MLQQLKKFFIAGVGALVLVGGQAGAITPSPQMIEQFKNLPKAEQERLGRQYGIDPSMLGGGSSAAKPLEQPQVVSERQQPVQIADAPKPSLDFSQQDIKAELRRFGYDLFAGEPSTFAPVSDVPVPAEYMVGPGDVLNVQLYGKENKNLSLTVGRDGAVQFPDLGPISLVGMSFSEAKAMLTDKVNQSMIGIQANITMGELRSIRIFVAGDAYRPGSYTVSSLSTITQALFVSGGVNEIGSLRNIQLKRNGRLMGTLDLYDLLLRGDASNDLRLQAGDVVFIPAVGALVSVDGEVRRPAIYEVKSGEHVKDVVNMAAGLLPGAYPKLSVVERFNQNGLKSLINLDLTSERGLSAQVKAGDYIRVKSASDQFDSAVTVVGAVVRPGKYQWAQGKRISDILPSLWGDLKVSADLDYGVVVREISKFGDIEVLQFAPGRAIVEPNSVDNLSLSPRDKIIVFNYSNETQSRYELNKLVKQRVRKITDLKGDSLIGADIFSSGFANVSKSRLQTRSELAGVVVEKQFETDEQKLVSGEVGKMLANLFDDRELLALSGAMTREELLYPVISKLATQNFAGQGVRLVSIAGQVKYPGVFPLASSATVKELIVAAGGLKEGAYTVRAELSRQNNQAEGSSLTHINIDLTDALSGGASNLALQGRDSLTVMTTPDWQENQTVEIRGEVKFPGVYSIRRGENLSEVIQRAGGFTDYAYLPSAVFVRESVRAQEQIEIKKLADQLRRDIATRGVSKDGNVINYSEAQLMLKDLENIKAVGRLVVDLPALTMGVKQADIQLEQDDVLYVPSTRQTIAVMGEVQHPTSHRFKEGITLDQYLAMSGGSRKRADDDRTYVIKANGSVLIPKGSLWFSAEDELMPGDTIVVPLDTEYKDNLTLWSQVTQIIYNTAVAVATISGL
ncbi:SLBB domain-containing protein [Shewanella sp. JM162201]|uniref:SLBB domain-containing protein n=1 Tax=Shewanella jiangmenensis TaxID=2837387 RepID=A0ABS5UZH0_9GAMM|nr:SLBB domain-containing protein [Shewanella jiangmenensis]